MESLAKLRSLWKLFCVFCLCLSRFLLTDFKVLVEYSLTDAAFKTLDSFPIYLKELKLNKLEKLRSTFEDPLDTTVLVRIWNTFKHFSTKFPEGFCLEAASPLKYERYYFERAPIPNY